MPCEAEIRRDSPFFVTMRAFAPKRSGFKPHLWRFLILQANAICLGGCGAPDKQAMCLSLERPQPLEGVVVAQVGDTAITAPMLPNLAQNDKDGGDASRALETVEDRIRFELLAQAAWRERIGNHPEVVDTARKVMVRRYLQAKVPLVSDPRSVDENMLLRAYAANRHLYLKPEMRRLDLVALPPGEPSRRLATRLIGALNQGLDPNEALKVAMRAARDVTASQGAKTAKRYRGPDPRWVATPFRTQRELTGKVGQAAASQIFALTPGVWSSEPIVTPRGFWVARVAARRADLARTLNDVRSELIAQLTRERRSKAFAALIDELRATTPVALYKDRIINLSEHTRGPGVQPEPTPVPDAPQVSKTGEMSASQASDTCRGP